MTAAIRPRATPCALGRLQLGFVRLDSRDKSPVVLYNQPEMLPRIRPHHPVLAHRPARAMRPGTARAAPDPSSSFLLRLATVPVASSTPHPLRTRPVAHNDLTRVRNPITRPRSYRRVLPRVPPRVLPRVLRRVLRALTSDFTPAHEPAADNPTQDRDSTPHQHHPPPQNPTQDAPCHPSEAGQPQQPSPERRWDHLRAVGNTHPNPHGTRSVPRPLPPHPDRGTRRKGCRRT